LHSPIPATELDYRCTSKLEAVVEELETLPPTGLAAAADFIYQLKTPDAVRPKHALNRAFGCQSMTGDLAPGYSMRKSLAMPPSCPNFRSKGNSEYHGAHDKILRGRPLGPGRAPDIRQTRQCLVTRQK